MASTIYDWASLKKEFMLGDYRTINEFIRAKGIEPSNTQRTHTKGWTQEKKDNGIKMVNKTIEKTIEKTAERNSEQLATINAIAQTLLDKISKATEGLSVEDIKGVSSGKMKELEYNGLGKVKREKTTAYRQSTIVELTNALGTIANILSIGTESQENKIDKLFDALDEEINGDN